MFFLGYIWLPLPPFPNPAGFSTVPKAAVLGGLTGLPRLRHRSSFNNSSPAAKREARKKGVNHLMATTGDKWMSGGRIALDPRDVNPDHIQCASYTKVFRLSTPAGQWRWRWRKFTFYNLAFSLFQSWIVSIQHFLFYKITDFLRTTIN